MPVICRNCRAALDIVTSRLYTKYTISISLKATKRLMLHVIIARSVIYYISLYASMTSFHLSFIHSHLCLVCLDLTVVCLDHTYATLIDQPLVQIGYSNMYAPTASPLNSDYPTLPSDFHPSHYRSLKIITL